MRNDNKKRYQKGIALALGSCLLLAGCGSKAPAENAVSAVVVDMQQARSGELTLKNSFVGIVSPQESVYVIPMAAGTVTDTYFEVGDRVNAGDVLFKIDDSGAQLQLEQAQLTAANARQQANMALGSQQESTNIQLESADVQTRSAYEQAQIQYVTLKNNHDDMNSAIDTLNDNINKVKEQIALASSVSGGNAAAVAVLQEQLVKLESSKSTAETQRTQLETQLLAAASAYRAAEQSLGITDKTRDLTQGQVLSDTRSQLNTSLQLANLGVESAELALSYYTVTAPISGTVQSKGVEVNGIAANSSPAYVIANENTMTVTFQVSEAVKNTLTLGQEIAVERGGRTFTGNVTEIGVAVNQQTGLFQIKAAVNADGDTLPSGVSVKLITDTYRTKNAVLIPYDAVYYDNVGAYVYLCAEGKAVKAYVETGIFDDTTIEIVSGISQDDTVITSWSPRLIDGVEVAAAADAE